MNSYQPNFNDPRVRSRVKQALGFACGVMSETKSRSWSTRYIDKFFGMSSRPLSKWLRNTLLITTKDNWNKNTGECKQYILNKQGVRYLNEILKLDNIQLYPIVTDLIKSQHHAELSSGKFPYNDKSNRLWHPLQRYRKQYRTKTLAEYGYLHDYDIVCSAPTLIYQYAIRCGMDIYPMALNKYLNDRTTIRQELAVKLELPIDAIKEIINALFAGAVISKNTETDIYHILNGDISRIEYLKQDQFLTELREDIKTCWEYIAPYMSRRRNAETNRLLPINSRQKWHLYFELERCVLNSVRTYLDEKNFRYFLLHDGWCCDNEIDKNELIDFVRTNTGYEIKFDYLKTSNIQLYPIVTDLDKGNQK